MLLIAVCVYKNDTLKFVKVAIESILNQTYSKFDLYVQFDGLIKNEVREYFDSIEDERLSIFDRLENKGLAISLNEIIRRGINNKYDYFARMDMDDISHSERIYKQIRFLETNPNVDCLGTWAIEIDESGAEYSKKRMPITHEDCYNFFKKRDCIIHPSVIFRSSYFEKAGLYPEDTYFAEDTMMWALGFKNGCIFANLPEFLLKFRLDSNFFERRRGWKHAKSIFLLRIKVTRMLNYGVDAYLYAFLYALAKMMPKSILSLLYRTVR